MAKTISELRNQSIQVRDASAAGENTATRVGTVLNDIVGHIEDYENTQSSNNSSQDAKIEGVKSSLNAEIARAKTEESNLSTQIDTERTERQAAVSREETARIQADNDEKTARQQADNAEQDARIKADNDEKTARENADITLKTMIQTEVSNRQIAVKQEEIRAMAAELANTQAIEDEVARLDTTDNEIKADLEAETIRAKAAEQAIIFDVSAYNDGAVFESLSALLSDSNLSTLIPTSVRHGGMSIRFIQGSEQGSDNKYVQYRLMAQYFSTTESDWQGVDDEPIAGSDNLVKSGGIANKISELESEVNLFVSDKISLIEGILVSNDGVYQLYGYGATDFVSVSEGDILTFYNTIPAFATAANLSFYDNEKNYIKGKQQSTLSIGIHKIEVPTNTSYVRVNYYTESKELFFLSINSANAKNMYDIAEGYSIPCTFTDYIEFDRDGANVVVKFNNAIKLVSKYGNEIIYLYKAGESYNIPEYSSLLYNIRSKKLEVVAFNGTPTDKDNVLIAYNEGGNIIAGICANLYISKSSKEYAEEIALNVGRKETLNPFGMWCDAWGTLYEVNSELNGYFIGFDGYFGTIKVFGTKPLTYIDESGNFYLYIACYNGIPSVGNNNGFIGRATLVSDDADGFEFSVPKGTKYILYTYEVRSYKDGSYIYTSQTFPIVKLIDDELSKKPSFKTLKNFNLVNVGHSIWWYDGIQLNESGFMGGVLARGYQTLLSENFEFKSITRHCYSGYALASIPTQQGIIEKFADNWQSINNAIWTVDTIVNDWGLDVELGAPSDYENNTGFNTFYGALRVLRDKIISLSDNAVVICASSLQDRGGDTENKVGYKPSQYALAMMYVAAKNNWYFVDQFNKGGITAENTVYTTLDGLHPNNFGYTLAVKPWIEQFNILQNIIG